MKFKRVYIWYAIPVLLLAAWVLVFYLPLSAKIKAKESELATLKQESERIDNEMKNMVEMKKRGEQAKASFEEFQAQLPVIDQLPDFMRTVVQSARKEGVMVENFNAIFPSIDTGDKMPLVSSVFEINLHGRFLDIGRFIEQMGEQKAFKEILLAKVAHNEKEYPGLNGKLIVEFKAWKGKISVEGK